MQANPIEPTTASTMAPHRVLPPPCSSEQVCRTQDAGCRRREPIGRVRPHCGHPVARASGHICSRARAPLVMPEEGLPDMCAVNLLLAGSGRG
ncbi:hypothetical protein BDA96_10G320600 [Sorghum bicolor]|uniref:Uncharacterized protein n=1 Tax=Sorghum bicolor TaxID=4558 RepID=A0A921Q5F2_SORBI|nr:hypothetical protein BDA96_10G320600 [Sorghum bicolor]